MLDGYGQCCFCIDVHYLFFNFQLQKALGSRRLEIRARQSEKIREARLRWLGHVERKTEEDVVMMLHGSGWTPNDRKTETEVE